MKYPEEHGPDGRNTAPAEIRPVESVDISGEGVNVSMKQSKLNNQMGFQGRTLLIALASLKR